MRISGVRVGKVKTREPNEQTGLTDTVLEIDSRYAPIPKRHARDPAAEVAARRDVRGALARHARPTAACCRTAARCRAGRWPTPSSSTRSCARFDPEHARSASRTWFDQAGVAARDNAEPLNDALAQLTPFAEDTDEVLQVLRQQSDATHRFVRDTGVRLRRAHRAQGPAARPDPELEPDLGGDREPRRGSFADTFRVFPTFLREGRATTERLTRFANNTNPLIDQLRPAAREISPTLQDLDKLAPDLKGVFTNLEPLVRVSKKGLPATGQVLDNTRPLLARLDPWLRNLTPIIDYLGLYRREIVAFFANDAAATQATEGSFNDPSKFIHYLRTASPVNPEMMTGWPFRLSTNRSNPYTAPGGYDKLRTEGHLEVFGQYLCTGPRGPAAAGAERVPLGERGRPDRAVHLRRRPEPRQGAPVRRAGAAGPGGRPVGPVPAAAAVAVEPPRCRFGPANGSGEGVRARRCGGFRIRPLWGIRKVPLSMPVVLAEWRSSGRPSPKLTPVIERLLRRLVGGVTRRPLPVLAVTAVLALAGAVLALRLEPSAATSTLVNRGSDTFKDTERFKKDFGDDAILVLVRGELTRTVLTSDLGRLIRLEGCLSGNVPNTKKGLGSLPPVCREIAKLHPGEGRLRARDVRQHGGEPDRRAVREAAAAARPSRGSRPPRPRGACRSGAAIRPAEQERLARAAADAVNAKFISDTLKLALRYGISGVPRINDPSFVSALVFDRTAGEPGVPKSRFAYLFPSKNAALIQIRLRPDLTDAERTRAIDLIETATEREGHSCRARARSTSSPASPSWPPGSPTRSRRRSSCCWGRRCS